MKAIILARVSTREQEEGHSIDAQIARFKEYCRRKQFKVLKGAIIGYQKRKPFSDFPKTASCTKMLRWCDQVRAACIAACSHTMSTKPLDIQ